MRNLKLAVVLLLLVGGCASPGPQPRPVPRPPQMTPEAENPQSAEDFVAQGDYYLAQRGREVRALASYTKALKRDPTGPTAGAAHCGMGEAYRRTRQYKEAAASFRSAIKADQTNPRPWTYLGVVYYDLSLAEGRLNQDHLTKTVEFTSKAITADPLYAEAYMWRGRARQFLGFKLEATQDYATALDIGLPREPELLVREQYANTLFDSGEYQQAVEQWRALQTVPEASSAQRRRWNELIKVADKARQKRDQPF